MAPLPIVSLEHVGIASDSSRTPLTDALEGQRLHGTVMPSGVTVAHFGPGDCLELLWPAHSGSPIDKFLERRGPGLHHLALRVDLPLVDLAESLKGAGLETIGGVERSADGRLSVSCTRRARAAFWSNLSRGGASVRYDTIVRNGQVVIPELPATQAVDVAILDGRIAALLDRGEGVAREQEYDTSGRVVMPGGVDPHVHVNWPYLHARTMDDYTSASRAAAIGGTTTILDFAIEGRDDPLQAVLARRDEALGASVVDFSFHCVVSDASPEVLQGLADVVGLGVTSFKIYMTYRRRGLAVDPATLAAVADVLANSAAC